MPVCEHIRVSLAQQMCQDLKQNALRVLSLIGVASLAPWWRKPAVILRVSLLLNSLPQRPPILVFVSSSHAPSLKALFSLEAAPSMQVALAPRMAVARKEVVTGCLVQGPGKGLGWRVQRYMEKLQYLD